MSEEGQVFSLKRWMDGFVARAKMDNDMVLAITGEEGSGKSSLALQMAAYMDPAFDPVKQVVFSGDQFARTAVDLPKYSAIILDESISGGFSRDAGAGTNKRLAKFLTVSRELNLLCFILWPNIRWLDPILKEHRCKWNVHIEKRNRDSAFAWVRQLRDGELVFERPKPIHPFTFPPAKGPKWDAYKKAKTAFVEEVGRGADDQEEMESMALLDQMRGELRAIVNRRVLSQ